MAEDQKVENDTIARERVETFVKRTFKRTEFQWNPRYRRTDMFAHLEPESNSYHQAWLEDHADEDYARRAHNHAQDEAFRAAVAAEHARRAKSYEDTKKEVPRILVIQKSKVYTAPHSTMSPGAQNALLKPNESSEGEKAELEASMYGWLEVPAGTTVGLDGKALTTLIVA